ncbi:MAG: DUF427 domain-containing protein [Burkholderiales bacterium]
MWTYPRPAIAEPSTRHIRIVHRGVVLADTHQAVRTLETSHPPTYYIPRSDILVSALRQVDAGSWCEWKGRALYYDVELAGERLAKVAWSYPEPAPPRHLPACVTTWPSMPHPSKVASWMASRFVHSRVTSTEAG